MFSIVGILIVFGCVIAGYLMEKGNMAVLVQPAELIIILGAAIGTVLTANPMHILKKIAAGLTGVIKGSPFPKKRYMLKTLKRVQSSRSIQHSSRIIMLANLFAIRCEWQSPVA